MRNNPVNLVDPMGLKDSSKKDYISCLADCITAYDPLSDEWKAAATAVGGTFPKSWFGFPRGFAGASPVSTLPSAAANAMGGGGAGTAGDAVRALGRVASPIWIGYGLYLAGMEGYCAYSCLQSDCAH